MAIGYLPTLGSGERKLFEKLLADGSMKAKHAKRLHAVLSRSEGIQTKTIAKVLHTDPGSISGWVDMFLSGGIEALVCDKSRKPGIPAITSAKEQEVCRLTVQEKPKCATHWSTRMMATRTGLSHNKISEIWRKYDLKPHVVKKFKISKDPNFESKMADVVGLYLNPPVKSMVFCVDEKSQIQALERSQPILPLRSGSPEHQTSDYFRHGTTTLFAALDVASGKVLGECKNRHTSKDFISFLDHIDKNTSKKYDLHIIADNYATHKTTAVKEFLNNHPRFHLHFTPTGSSWLNLVERWFAEITRKQIKRGNWHSVAELKKSIYAYLRNNNKNPKPFIWKKSSSDIMKKIKAFS